MTEFTCRSGGSNLNAGTLDGVNEASTTPLVTYTNGTYNATTRVFTPASGNPVTDGVIAGTHWVGVSDGLPSLRVTGVATSNASCPDSVPLSITGDIDIRIRVKANDWTPSASQTLVSKYGAAGQRSFIFVLLAAGTLQYIMSNNGTATPVNVTSTASTSTVGVVDGGTLWLRVTHDVDNGAAGNDVRFYTSLDGSTWTQLGSTVTTAGTTSIFDSTTALQVGEGNSVLLIGNIYSAEVRNGIGGTIVANPDFSAQSPGTTSFSDTAGTPNTWSVGAAASIVAATGAQLTSLVSARDATTITLDATRKSGGATTGTCTLRVGGAWRGPNGADPFPFGHVNQATVVPRVNLKNDQTYNITAGLVPLVGPVIYQGYTGTFGDLGRFVLDGGTSGASYQLITAQSSGSPSIQLLDFVVQNNGASGSATAVFSPLGGLSVVARGKIQNVRGVGLSLPNNNGYRVSDVELTGCNQSNTPNFSAMAVAGDVLAERLYIHDNVGSNTAGVVISVATNFMDLVDCIFDSNGSHAIHFSATGGSLSISGGAFYGNGGSGVRISGASGYSRLTVENCGFDNNAAYAVDASGAGQRSGRLTNCQFGVGAAANSLGDTNALRGIDVEGTIVLPAGVTPWKDPANGDFTVVRNEMVFSGRGNIPSGATVSYPSAAAGQGQASLVSRSRVANHGGG